MIFLFFVVTFLGVINCLDICYFGFVIIRYGFWRVEKRNVSVSGCSFGGVVLYKFWRTDVTFVRGIYEIINGCAGIFRFR